MNRCYGEMGTVNFEMCKVDFEINQGLSVMGTVNFEIGKVDFEIDQCLSVNGTVLWCDELTRPKFHQVEWL